MLAAVLLTMSRLNKSAKKLCFGFLVVFFPGFWHISQATCVRLPYMYNINFSLNCIRYIYIYIYI